MSIVCTSLFPQNKISGVYMSDTDTGCQVEIFNNRFLYVENHTDLASWWGEVLAEAEYVWVSDDFIELLAVPPNQVADKSIVTIMSNDSMHIDFTYLTLKMPAGSSRPLDVEISYLQNNNWQTIKTVYYNTMGRKTVLLPNDIRKISLLVKPQKTMPIPADKESGLYFSAIYYKSSEIEIGENINDIYIDIPALDAGFWGRYYINGEYIKVEENKIVWRGRTFYKNTSKESLKYIQFMESEPQMSRAEVRSRYLYNVNPNVSNKRK